MNPDTYKRKAYHKWDPILIVEDEQHDCRFLENAITEARHIVVCTDALAGTSSGVRMSAIAG